MRSTHRTLLAALLILPAAASGVTQEPLPDPRQPDLTPSQKLEKLVERVRLEHSRVETLEADFTQSKESALLIEPDLSEGVFSYSAPDRVRWEYLSPIPMSLLIYGEEMTTWFRDLGQAERTNIGGKSQRVLEYMGASSSLDTLLEYFTVTLTLPRDTTRPYILELSPKFEQVERRLRGMIVWIDADRFLPIGVRYIEADGDVTEYRFNNMRVNSELPADRFELDLPSETDLREVDLDGQGVR